jgi:hypothetical protein
MLLQSKNNQPLLGELKALEKMLHLTQKTMAHVKGKRVRLVDEQHQDWEVRYGLLQNRTGGPASVLVVALVYEATRSRHAVPQSIFEALSRTLLDESIKRHVSAQRVVPAVLSPMTASHSYNGAHLTAQWFNLLQPYTRK